MPELIFSYPPMAWIALLIGGLLIGVLAGLLGVGGGVVAVPLLLEVFQLTGVADEAAVPLAVGTAQTSILIASVSAVYAHFRAGTIDRLLVRAWLPSLTAGVIAGLLFSHIVPTKALTLAFAVIAAMLGVKMAAGDRLVLGRRLPTGPGSHVAPALVGALAAALGIGGGTLSTPVLSLFSFPIRRAIGAGALFNLLIAVPAAATFLAIGLDEPGRPADAVGHVALLCVAGLSLPALLVAPVAAAWSTRVRDVLLRRSFALCLGVIAARLLMRL